MPGGGGVYSSGPPSAIRPQPTSGSSAATPAAPSRVRRVGVGGGVCEERGVGGITPGRPRGGRRVLLRPAQRDPPAAHEREQRRDARGTEQGAAGRGGRRRVSGTGHGRILASQAPVEARTGPGHYPGGIGPGAPRASQTPIA